MPHRILHIIPTLDQAGAEKQLSLLVTRLPRAEFDVRVVALTRGGPWLDRLRRAGIHVEVIGKSMKIDPWALHRLYRSIRSWDPMVVHTWIFAANCYGRIAARWAGVPRIVAAERCVDQWKQSWELAIDRYLAKSTDAFVVNSSGTRDFYVQRGLPAGKFEVIPNGVEVPEGTDDSEGWLREELQLPSDSKLVVTVGRLWPQKRVKDLIWAIDLLKAVRSDVHLVIVGDGPQAYALERYRNSVRLNNRVHFLGHRNDVARILRTAACFWLGSGYEGQSNALMEAMSVGLPVIATDIPGNRDLIQHGHNGWLVPVGDSAGFARQTIKLLSDPDLGHDTAARAKTSMQEQFSIHRMVERYIEFYRRILDSPDSTASDPRPAA